MEDKIIQLRKRGVFTLPKELRDKYRLEEGDSLRLADLGGVLVLTPKAPLVPELSSKIEQKCVEAGVSTSDFLEGLKSQRERYYKEKFESAAGREESDNAR